MGRRCLLQTPFEDSIPIPGMQFEKRQLQLKESPSVASMIKKKHSIREKETCHLFYNYINLIGFFFQITEPMDIFLNYKRNPDENTSD